MAASAFVVHNGNLDGDEELTSSLGLAEGTRLTVSAHDNQQIVLSRETSPETTVRDVKSVMAAWDAWHQMYGFLPARTAEWQAKAEERKRMAQEALDRVYADPDAGATEIKRAEREWELADDELDFGPFRER